jgi:benzodiazapine receptor
MTPSQQGRQLRRWTPGLVAFGGAVVVAVLGGAATEIGPWYRGLQKPFFQPPDWLFGPAWTVIFALTALAALEAWNAAPTRAARERLLLLYALNGALNVLWSVLFFRLRHPDWALVEVVFLWLSILSLVIASGRQSRRAGWLLLPYLAWVSFAAVLNWAVVQLNPA